MTIADDQRPRTREVFQSIQCALGFLFLNDGDAENEDHTAKQECGFLRIA